ncbi:MAG: hypothetical protein OHK0012_11630 [Synechococcales cyanobacterium]
MADVERLRQQLDEMMARSPVDFAGKRKCTKGYNCGGSCITNLKECRKEMSGQAVNITQRLEAALRAQGIDPSKVPPPPEPKKAGGGDSKPAETPKAAVKVGKPQVGPETRRKDGRRQIEVTAEVTGAGNDGPVKMRVEETREGTGSWRVLTPYSRDGKAIVKIWTTGLTKSEALKQAESLLQKVESRAENGLPRIRGFE